MRVLVARPAEAETGLSHAALGDLLGPLVEGLPADFPAPQRRALDVALLRTAAAPGAARSAGGRRRDARRAARGRRGRAGARGRRRHPVARPCLGGGAPLRVPPARATTRCCSSRRGVRASAAPSRSTSASRRSGSRASPSGRSVHGRSKRMVQSRLGESVPPPALARMTEIAGGNPYFALELARAALRQAGGAALSASCPCRRRSPPCSTIGSAHLPAETRDALGAVAAMGHPTVASVSAVLDPGALDEAFEAGVLHEQGDAIRFDHPLLAEAAYRMLAADTAARGSQRLADAHDGRGRARPPSRGGLRRPRTPRWLRPSSRAPRPPPSAERSSRRRELLEASARLEPDFETAARRRITAVGHYMLVERARACGCPWRACRCEICRMGRCAPGR